MLADVPEVSAYGIALAQNLHPSGKVIPMKDSDFCNHLVGSRTSLRPAEQIVCPVEIAGHDTPSNDPDDPLAPFVHERQSSMFVFCSPSRMRFLPFAKSHGEE
jgi:hypothetical protein